MYVSIKGHTWHTWYLPLHLPFSNGCSKFWPHTHTPTFCLSSNCDYLFVCGTWWLDLCPAFIIKLSTHVFKHTQLCHIIWNIYIKLLCPGKQRQPLFFMKNVIFNQTSLNHLPNVTPERLHKNVLPNQNTCSVDIPGCLNKVITSLAKSLKPKQFLKMCIFFGSSHDLPIDDLWLTSYPVMCLCKLFFIN